MRRLLPQMMPPWYTLANKLCCKDPQCYQCQLERTLVFTIQMLAGKISKDDPDPEYTYIEMVEGAHPDTKGHAGTHAHSPSTGDLGTIAAQQDALVNGDGFGHSLLKEDDVSEEEIDLVMSEEALDPEGEHANIVEAAQHILSTTWADLRELVCDSIASDTEDPMDWQDIQFVAGLCSQVSTLRDETSRSAGTINPDGDLPTLV